MTVDLVKTCTLGALLSDSRRRLQHAGVESPALDARLLLEFAASTDHATIITASHAPVPPEVRETFERLIARRLDGEPVHRILGWREFYGLKLAITPDVLDPRPDTETLVELALPHVRDVARARGRCSILDLGTGSGALALALLANEPLAHATGSDISLQALEVAHRNATANGLGDRFRPMISNWFAAIRGRFHIIVVNPPYIPGSDIDGLAREVSLHDPVLALDGGADGLESYRAIAARALDHIHEDGHLFVETGCDQQEAVVAIFEENGLRMRSVRKDLAGLDRAIHFAP